MAIGAASSTASALGIAGVTGGVGSGMLGAAAAGAAGGVVTTTAQHIGATVGKDEAEKPSGEDYLIGAVAGAAGGALGGTVISRSAGEVARGGAMTAANIRIADA